MIVHFYQFDPRGEPANQPALAGNMAFRTWTTGDGLRLARRPIHLAWWMMARLGFLRGELIELGIKRDGVLVQRLIVTPPWHRFPFMGSDDVQIGDVWTAPAARRMKLARAAMIEARRRFERPQGKLWYLADANNRASAALARSCGFRLVATGIRTRPLNIGLLGQYVITRTV